MNSSEPTPDHSDKPIGTPVPDEAVRDLADAIARLNVDGPYFVRALTEYLVTLRPISRSGGLTKEQEQFLIESDAFTADELAETMREVEKGALQLGSVEVFLSHLNATLSLQDAAGFLGWDEDRMRAAISEGQLYGTEISGRLRFPVWQFHLPAPSKLLPHLTEIIEAGKSRSGISMNAFMNTPQESLVAEGRKTPIAWLRDGGDLNAVKRILETDRLW